MTYSSQKRIEAILKLPKQKRYSHFIKEAVGNDEIWTLYKGEFVEDFKNSEPGGQYSLFGDDNSNVYIGLWPAEEFATLFRTDTWEDFEPLCMGVEEFLEEYLPHFLEHNIKVCVFPTTDDSGGVPSIDDFVRDLNLELSWYK